MATFERTDGRMGTGLVTEKLGPKLRKHEQRIVRGTRRIGAGLQGALSRHFTRLTLSKRRYADPEGSSGISLTPGIQTLNLERKSKDDTMTRRTTPSARTTARKRSDSTAVISDEDALTSLERKGTYLLTNSPVQRSRRMFEDETESSKPGLAVSAETLEAAFEAGAGIGATSRSAENQDGETTETNLAYRFVQDSPAMQPTRGGEIREPQEDGDISALALDSPLPASAPSYSHSTRTDNQGQIYGPRPIKKSLSLSTTATVATRRALPTPPIGDPLGAAPAYSPPHDHSIVRAQIKEEPTRRDERMMEIGIDVTTGLRTHPFASASATTDQQVNLSASRPEFIRRHGHVPLATSASQSESSKERNGLRFTSPSTANMASTITHPSGMDMEESAVLPPSRGLGLTAVNLSRLNSTTRTSQVNPLVRTFTSPIGSCIHFIILRLDLNNQVPSSQIFWIGYKKVAAPDLVTEVPAMEAGRKLISVGLFKKSRDTWHSSFTVPRHSQHVTYYYDLNSCISISVAVPR